MERVAVMVSTRDVHLAFECGIGIRAIGLQQEQQLVLRHKHPVKYKREKKLALWRSYQFLSSGVGGRVYLDASCRRGWDSGWRWSCDWRG